MLRQLDLSALGREQLGLLDDLAATLMGVVSVELLHRDGWSLKPSWAPVETSPAGDLVPVDHAYRLVHEEKERWLYVSEPYPQTAATLSGLTMLVAQGWHVDVRSGFVLHYPGRTLRIQIKRAGGITASGCYGGSISVSRRVGPVARLDRDRSRLQQPLLHPCRGYWRDDLGRSGGLSDTRRCTLGGGTSNDHPDAPPV